MPQVTTDDNPEGVDGGVYEAIKAAILKDRYAYFKDFFDNFYNVDKLAPERISDQAWQASFNVAAAAAPYASYACVDTWLTDFRPDLPKIDVPVLVGPHNIGWTHPDEVNRALLALMADKPPAGG